jgi:hypothetical protein
MEDKCAFNDPILHGGFGCRHASPVARRAGPDITCSSAPDQLRCARLLECLKAAGLPALGYQDDLLTMPHSALMKLKFGGLLGLNRLLGDTNTMVADVCGLIDAAIGRYGSVESLPVADTVEDMKAHSVRRRAAGSRRDER